MDTILILFARLHRSGQRPENVRLNLTIPQDRLHETRHRLKEDFRADEILLMYEQNCATSTSPQETRT